MSISYANIKEGAVRLLNESLDTTLADLDQSQAVLRNLDTFVVDATNAAQNWMARRVCPLPATSAYSLAANAKSVAFSALDLGNGRKIWAVEAVLWSVNPLRQVDRHTLQLRDRAYEYKTGAAPIYWYSDADILSVYPIPTKARTLTVQGLCLPTPVVASGATATTTASPSFIADDTMRELLIPCVAISLAKKAFDDPSVYGRLGHLVRQINERAIHYWQVLPENYRPFYPTEPDVEGI